MLSCFNNIKKITLEVLFHMALFFFLLWNHFIYIMHQQKIWLCAAARSIYLLTGQSEHSSDVWRSKRFSCLSPIISHSSHSFTLIAQEMTAHIFHGNATQSRKIFVLISRKNGDSWKKWQVLLMHSFLRLHIIRIC